ncbi:MAG: conjugal transfer protein TraO [Sedimenticola sp.]|nr:MAG: conjugal transfer protein TraO [Sedimenticola sp.]
MKQRLVVMNGSRIVQTEQGGEWKNEKVDKAGSLKPGMYNLYLAQEADKGQSYDGQIVHADRAGVYQQIGKKFVMHSPKDFDIVPTIGSAKSINYDAQGKAQVSAMAAQRGRSRSR